ncbi:MAG: right-handed parallel beta-helix repeat-containing protein, partial [Thermoguttaceae bacterium]
MIRLALLLAVSLLAPNALLLPAAAQGASPPADLYVSPAGNDAWSGTLAEPNAEKTDGPLATVHRARDLVRDIKSRADRAAPVVVALRGGTYYLPKTLAFTPADSGTAEVPIVYRAFPGERPILSGGRPIRGWNAGPDGRWTATLDDVKQGRWTFSQLFVDDQRRMRPRLPKQGCLTTGEVMPAPEDKRGFDRLRYQGDAVRDDWANRDDVELIGFHQWGISRLRIESIDTQERIIRFTGTTYGKSWWNRFPEDDRFFVENVKEQLSDPGEWYLDRPTGVLTYIPKPGEDPEQAVVVAPVLDRIVDFQGDLETGAWVEHIQFQGITFAHSQWLLAPEGQSIPQAEVALDAAITAVGARSVTIENCAVRHTGAYAIAFGHGCRDNTVEGCELVDLGAGGVKIGHAGPGDWTSVRQLPDDREKVCSHITVRNCYIAHGGRLHPAAIGVWVGLSGHNRVLHNTVHDLYYSSFSIGWTWGYHDTPANHNELGYNHAYNIGQGVLSDMGGVYTLGVSPGTRVHHNRFHDITSYRYGGWGLYTDEGSTGVVMENNLVYRTTNAGFHQHYGRENRIRNNILAFGSQQQVQRTRTEDHISFFFERNIVYWDNESPAYGSNWRDDNFESDYNVFFNAGGHPVVMYDGMDLKTWQEKRKKDEHSIIADPGFAAPKEGDFSLPADSPALKTGFVPFDISTAGRPN